MQKQARPKWQQEIDSFKGIKSTFIIEGNINDFYPIFGAGQAAGEPKTFVDLNTTLFDLFNPNKQQKEFDFLFCDPATGIYNRFVRDAEFEEFEQMVKMYDPESRGDGKISFGIDRVFKKTYKMSDIERLSTAVKNAVADLERTKPVAVVMNFASRYISSPNQLDPGENKMFLNLLFASLNAAKIGGLYNTLILVVEKFNDLPAWFFYNNPNVRTITIPSPDKRMRSVFIRKEYTEFAQSTEMGQKLNKFIDITEGLKYRELKELRTLFHRLQRQNPDMDIMDAVSIYKYGIVENMWNTINKETIANLEDSLKKRVMGQDQAVAQTVKIVKRAVTGLSGLQHSSGSNKPRGVLFFAGPTGTGKTELTKAVAEQLFGDDKNCIRFDMSEFAESHADQKLFGAPPGYVGYEAGGQLTNAIKEKPFSILLFDEIEKAHPSIMDKFLQILEDGRMTDGQGNTVYFSETLIIFTSNLGITQMVTDANGVERREQLVSPRQGYEEIVPIVMGAIKNHFKPEVLNRIGNNVIVFDFIRQEAARSIVKSQIKKINDRIYHQSKIEVDASGCVEYFCELANEESVLEMGGRGIGNLMEEKYINVLAAYIFDANSQSGDRIRVRAENNRLVIE